MKKINYWSMLAIMMVALLSVGLTSCSDDEDEDEWVRPTFTTLKDIVGHKFVYNDVLDENLNYKYKSSQYHTISFFSGGTYTRTYDVYTSNGTFTFDSSTKTIKCKEHDYFFNERTNEWEFTFIDTDKDGYYFKVSEYRPYYPISSTNPFIYYYRFYYVDLEE